MGSMPDFSPNGVITLTTDFGLSDPYVGIMKGVILGRCRTSQLVDLSHQVPAFQPQLAGFWLARAYRHFPSGTVHLAVVDPGVGTERKMICLLAHGQLFVAPDNGLLTQVYASAAAARWQVFTVNDLSALRLPEASHTFHGRDIFAPLVAEIAAGRCAPGRLGEVAHPPITSRKPGGEGCILWADHFGNLITDVVADELARFRQPALRWRTQTIPVATSYGFAAAGNMVAVVNSWGTLEIAVVEGNAQQTLDVRAGEAVALIETAPKPW